MVILVDIDETICSNGGNANYSEARPIPDYIDKINNLYDKGHQIIYWTARGTQTGHQWFHITLHQLQSWGCKFHELRMGKPYYDMLICDKTKRIEEI
jgi:hypothetical protein